MPTRTLTILFTDIQGFTARTSAATRQGVANLLEVHERLLAPVFAHYQGKVVKTIGDAFLVTFESPTDAVVCGLAIQEVLRRHNAQVEDGQKLLVRVAINVGEVEIKDGDIFGEPVNLAARLEGITEAGEVYFTEAVYLTMNRHEAPSTAIGEHTFKGIPGMVRVYKVLQDEGSEQIKQIAQTLEVGDGRVTFLGPAHPSAPSAPVERLGAPHRKGPLVGRIALSALILAAVLGGWWAKGIVAERMTATRAQSLLDQKDPKGALMLLENALDKDPDRPKLVAVALDIAQQQAAALEKDKHPRLALEYLQEQRKAHPYLASLKDKEPALETSATLREMLFKGTREDPFFEKVDDFVLNKYPTDPDVAYAAAEAINIRFIPRVVFPRLELALARGHARTELMYQVAIKTLSQYAPDEDVTQVAWKMIDGQFPERKLGWAQDALAHGTGYGLLNAWPLLTAARDPKLTQPMYVSYHSVMVDQDVAAATDAIAALSDPDQAHHAQRVLKDALDISHRPAATRALLQKAMDTLTTKFGPLPEPK